MNIRYGKFFHYPRQVAKHLLSSIYPVVVSLWPLPAVMSIEDTINLIIKRKCSVARFGDSEFLYIVDRLNLPYQKYDTGLAQRLQDILAYRDEVVVVGLPSGYHSLETQIPRSVRFWRSQIAWVYPRLRKYINRKKEYINASMSRLYIELKDKSKSRHYFSIVKQIWQGRELLIVEGEKSRLGAGNDLFSGAISVRRILCPMHNAYEVYPQILETALKSSNDSTLVLIALGPTAKPLAYDMAANGVQAIDIGNIDIEYEWFLSNAKVKQKVEGKYTSEVSGGRIVEDLIDDQYTSQIITKIDLNA